MCEGQTEEQYFKAFPVVSASVKAVPLGCSKTALVDCAKEMASVEEFDEIWCVFDMDLSPDKNGQIEDFNSAINKACNEGFRCGYSNDSFELWFVLHYCYVDQKFLRDFYNRKLSDYWEINYAKKGKILTFANSIYERLAGDKKAGQREAIKRAKKLYSLNKGKNFHLQNPVTKVYELVEELNKYLRA